MKDKLRVTVPSVHHYLIADPEKKMVIHHARGRGEALQTRLRPKRICGLTRQG